MQHITKKIYATPSMSVEIYKNNNEDRILQLILWRDEPTSKIKVYTLNTVTYGTTCAPYLAMKCLQQLAIDEQNSYPEAANILRRDFYMDGVLTGANTLEETAKRQKDLLKLPNLGKFELRKWRSNDQKILRHMKEEAEEQKLLILDKKEPSKTLGLLWHNYKDMFLYKVQVKQIEKITKRQILSAVAQIYDPMGLVGPIVMKAKITMQELWILKLNWDEPVTGITYTNWTNYYETLENLNKLEIPRNVNPRNDSLMFSLHGFADASEKGYGACVYVLSHDGSGKASCFLLCSKSRVAPLKKVTIPKLELCAAALLAKLLELILDSLDKEKIKDITLWTDSTIVLYWIKTHPAQLKTFVANRVAMIQELTTNFQWRHVGSQDNPADLLSRGTTADVLLETKLWWYGSNWLLNKKEWPQGKFELKEELPEKRTVLILTTDSYLNDVIQRYPSYSKLKRIIANCYRFCTKTQDKKIEGPISVEELNKAEISILRIMQKRAFQQEYQTLERNLSLNPKSKIIALEPFLDEDGLLRVGGRLQYAPITEEQRHPILLPARCFITELILRELHLKLKHCGPEHLLTAARARFWPVFGRRETRKITRKCIACYKFRPKPTYPIMGNLPEARVSGGTRPFYTTGVDYAGPLQVRESKRQGRIPVSKAYIAVFTCFTSKAVHLELVSDLTSEAFLAALRRFIARRGLCKTLYSDNATNFVGAARELEEIFELVSKNRDRIKTELAEQLITWKLIPPRAPHFGGIWEAAVKSTKRHLYTVTQGLTYTFEEYYTLLAEIESVLNSRPLTALSSDPHDLKPLTPSHFIYGASPLEPISLNYIDTPNNHLSRWQHIQCLKQHFWKRWTKAYLHHLQSRTKWIVGNETIKNGTLVLIADDNTAPFHWALGRVIQVYPGDDGVVRVASVKTSHGIFKRPVIKLCALPLES